jgi:hypothetical protein
MVGELGVFEGLSGVWSATFFSPSYADIEFSCQLVSQYEGYQDLILAKKAAELNGFESLE